MEPDDLPEAPGPSAALPAPAPVPRIFRWMPWLVSAITGLISLWAGLAFTRLVEDLFARSQFLGWLAAGLLTIAGLAALAIVLREIIGLMRLRKITTIHRDAELALSTNDAKAAQRTIAALKRLYKDRPDTAWGLARLKEHEDQIMDGADRLRLAGRDLLAPLDDEAGRVISKSARSVTLLTAVTPAAVLDIAFVAARNLTMLRTLATLYGGRPGTIGTLRLARMVISHLAITGGLALSDGLMQQFIGKGLLGRLSARFGEGAVNGILTTRIGLAALDLCRPIPFDPDRKPALSDVLRRSVIPQGETPDTDMQAK